MKFLVLSALLVFLIMAFSPVVYAQGGPVMETPLDDLVTVAGIAALLLILTGLVLKPLWRVVLGEEHTSYQVALNVTTILLGIVLAQLAVPVVGVSYANIVNLALVGVLGGCSAIGGYEISRARAFRPS